MEYDISLPSHNIKLIIIDATTIKGWSYVLSANFTYSPADQN